MGVSCSYTLRSEASPHGAGGWTPTVSLEVLCLHPRECGRWWDQAWGAGVGSDRGGTWWPAAGWPRRRSAVRSQTSARCRHSSRPRPFPLSAGHGRLAGAEPLGGGRERVPLPASLYALRNLCVCELLPPRHVLRGRRNTQPVPAASCRGQEGRAASALGLRAEGPPADVCGVASRARACRARLVLPTPRGEAGRFGRDAAHSEPSVVWG